MFKDQHTDCALVRSPVQHRSFMELFLERPFYRSGWEHKSGTPHLYLSVGFPVLPCPPRAVPEQAVADCFDSGNLGRAECVSLLRSSHLTLYLIEIFDCISSVAT